MLSVQRLYLRESRFKCGKLLAKFPLKFSICLTEPLSLQSAVKLKVTAVKITGLHSQRKVVVGLSVHKNI